MKTRIAVLSVSFTILIYMVISVAVAGLTEAFPGISQDTLLLAVTLPNLTCIPAFLLAPLLLRRFNQKAVTLLGLSITLFCGVLCLLFPTRLWVVLGTAALMGLGYGIAATMYPLLVNTHFTGSERVVVMGYCSGMLQLGRLTAILLGGFLADIHWSYIYFTFIFILAAMVVVGLWLPGSKTMQRSSAGESSDSTSLKNPQVWRLGLLSVCFAVVYFLSNTHLSLYVEGLGLGTASTTGAITSATCVLAVLISCSYGRLPRQLREHVPTAAFLLMGLGYLMAGTFVSLPAITATVAAATVAIALFNPWFMLQVNVAAGRNNAPVATSMALILINLGYFISPYVTGALSVFTGGGTAQLFLATGIFSLVLIPLSRLIYHA